MGGTVILTNSVIGYTEVALEGPIYEDLDGKLSLEVRDLPEGETAVITVWMRGTPFVYMVNWNKFTDAIDGMRSRMIIPDNWDAALAGLTGGEE